MRKIQKDNVLSVQEFTETKAAKAERAKYAFQHDAGAYLRDMGFNVVVRTEAHKTRK